MPVERGLSDPQHHAAADLGVADHASPAHFLLTGLELRLDHCQRLPAGRGQRQRRWKHQPEADERDVTDHQLRREWKLAELASVHALEHDHARVVAQFLRQLPVADIERDHPTHTALEQAVREAARGGADIEAIHPGRIDAEHVERMCELLAATRDEGRLGYELYLGVLGHLLPGFFVAAHATGHDERLGLGPRLGQSALDEQDVEPFPCRAVGHVPCTVLRFSGFERLIDHPPPPTLPRGGKRYQRNRRGWETELGRIGTDLSALLPKHNANRSRSPVRDRSG